MQVSLLSSYITQDYRFFKTPNPYSKCKKKIFIPFMNGEHLKHSKLSTTKNKQTNIQNTEPV